MRKNLFHPFWGTGLPSIVKDAVFKPVSITGVVPMNFDALFNNSGSSSIKDLGERLLKSWRNCIAIIEGEA